jgi:hypothetical protein
MVDVEVVGGCLPAGVTTVFGKIGGYVCKEDGK